MVIFLCLFWFSFCSSLFWELRDNGVMKKNPAIFTLKSWNHVRIFSWYTPISRKVGKNVHATIPADTCNMGYTVGCWTYFCCFSLALANIHTLPLVPWFFHFFWRTVNSKPPTIPFVIVACTFNNNNNNNNNNNDDGDDDDNINNNIILLLLLLSLSLLLSSFIMKRKCPIGLLGVDCA